MAERVLMFRVSATTVDATTQLDRLTSKLQEVNLKTEGTGDKFTQLDRSAEKLAARLGVELSPSTDKTILAFQTLYDNLVKVGAPMRDQEKAFQALQDAQERYAEKAGPSFWDQYKTSILAAGAAIVAFGAGCVKAFIDSEAHTMQLDAALKATGVATGLTRDQMLGMADALSKETIFTKSAIKEAESVVGQFEKETQDEFF
jgi:hypothetical protein